jgi:hypothetical protein
MTLAVHGFEIELETLVQQVVFLHGADFKGLQPFADPRPVFDVDRFEVIIPPAADVRTPGYTGPLLGLESHTECAIRAEESPDSLGRWLERLMVGKAYQEMRRYAVPERAAGFYDLAPAQSKEIGQASPW